jgi:hypothetical protein
LFNTCVNNIINELTADSSEPGPPETADPGVPRELGSSCRVACGKRGQQHAQASNHPDSARGEPVKGNGVAMLAQNKFFPAK